MKNKMLAVTASVWLALLAACGSTDNDKPRAQKVDELAAVWLAYDASEQTQADKTAAIDAAFAVLDVDVTTLDDVVPTASAIMFADEIVAKHPEFLSIHGTIAKLFTLALYGSP